MHYNHIISRFWLRRQFSGKPKWSTFCHNGILFPPSYIPHNKPVIYNNASVFLNPIAEEAATFFARYKESDYFKNRTFRRNFWRDWKKLLSDDTPIKNLDDCDFSQIYDHILKTKEQTKALSKEAKQRAKDLKLKIEEKYKTAIVDGIVQPVGNFRMEIPGIFIGRGCHPKLGRIKPRYQPEDVTINIDKQCPVPDPIAGHQWGNIVHDRAVEWLASWKDAITGKVKYVWLGSKSKFKAQSDINKFNLARKLKKQVKRIRDANDANLSSSNPTTRQIATALYFIDKLALRVGNEKGTDEADTVGVTSLRVEHVKLLGNNKITLDFLGKDSIRYIKTFDVSDTIYNNLTEFTKNKSKDTDLFDLVKSTALNSYLQSFMKNLTAKVFRTFNASCLFQKELNKVSRHLDNYEELDKINLLLDGFNKANIKVALLCNHRKAVSKNFNTQLKKIDEQIKTLYKRRRKIKTNKKNQPRIDKIKNRIRNLKAKKALKIDLKDVSLGTSKTNYIDPRITVSFMKKHNIPIKKVFAQTLQDKFHWAFDVGPDFKF